MTNGIGRARSSTKSSACSQTICWRPRVVHCELQGNEIGLLSRVKNWRYGAGGRPILVRTLLSGNLVDFDQDSSSYNFV